jgi:hypothetical protein
MKKYRASGWEWKQWEEEWQEQQVAMPAELRQYRGEQLRAKERIKVKLGQGRCDLNFPCVLCCVLHPMFSFTLDGWPVCAQCTEHFAPKLYARWPVWKRQWVEDGIDYWLDNEGLGATKKQRRKKERELALAFDHEPPVLKDDAWLGFGGATDFF